jgi:chromosome condensin MukBEF ATPase and DNA-binding subunit MukB
MKDCTERRIFVKLRSESSKIDTKMTIIRAIRASIYPKTSTKALIRALRDQLLPPNTGLQLQKIN